MHGWIKSALLHDLEDKFVAGQMYEIQNFMVAPFTQKYKCFDANTQIILSNLTVVTQLAEYNAMIPHNIYYFRNLAQLETIAHEDNHLIGMFIIL